MRLRQSRVIRDKQAFSAAEVAREEYVFVVLYSPGMFLLMLCLSLMTSEISHGALLIARFRTRLFMKHAVTCPSGWTTGSDKCYLITGQTIDWSQAKAYCEGLSSLSVGGQARYPSLLTMDSSTEMSSFLTLSPQNKNYWLNCDDIQVEGTFVCQTTRDGAVTNFRCKSNYWKLFSVVYFLNIFLIRNVHVCQCVLQ